MNQRIDFPDPLNDADLVAQIRGGDDNAFSRLYRRHARYLAKVIYRILGNDRDLDDMMQETFSTALHRIDALKEPDKVRPWLVQIAVRHTQKRLNRTKRISKLHLEAHRHAAAEDNGPDQAKALLYAAFWTLDEKLRIPLILNRIEGMTLRKTAQACDISLATVKRRISKAETKLERTLHAYQ